MSDPMQPGFTARALTDESGNPSSVRVSGFLLILNAVVMAWIALAIWATEPRAHSFALGLVGSILTAALALLGAGQWKSASVLSAQASVPPPMNAPVVAPGSPTTTPAIPPPSQSPNPPPKAAGEAK